jgi:hypothetical protein
LRNIESIAVDVDVDVFSIAITELRIYLMNRESLAVITEKLG